ncbi:MAG: outer membrane beta-barrel protein [Gemmatimonadota bacterium]
MRIFAMIAVTTSLMVPMVTAPAAAQNYRWDIGINGGGSWYSPMLDGEATGLPDGSDRDEVMFKAGWLGGAQIGYWFRPNIGLRGNLTYSERPVVYDNEDLLEASQGTVNVFDDVNLWSGSLDLLWRFRQPNTEWSGRELLPYLALGLGGKWVNPGGDPFDCVDGDESWSCHPFTVTDGTTAGNSFALGEKKVLMGLVGLGTDIRLAPNFALRLELNDRIYKPEIYAASPTITGNEVTLTDGDELVSDVVHEVGAQLGLHLLMGLDRPRVVTVAPPPAPAPAPVPAPLPPPAPREEAITVCIVDPMTPTGLRTQSALYRVEQRDTVVMLNGTRVPLRESVGMVMVARDADWYVRGQPLTITIGDESVEYITYQGARQINATNLAYLGLVNGYPVYADRDEVADVIDALDSVRQADRSRDLGEILDERADLRDEIEDVQYLYVPLQPTGCIFQPLQLMEQVRKTGK